ncbi:MAG: pantoate--beta-alanine ligase [Acidobacteriota bacterium]|jgi:pantoate--beta-alanine ligase|nr:pantoate--beta-alanine ligase [Acidobacteriota bacterium]
MASVARKLRREEDKTIGLVPTMGALHDGHLSLVREARRMCDVVIVSVFVNPAQFGPAEDFTRYPRDLTGDTTKLADYNVDYIFAPPVEEIYPKGFATYVTVEGLSESMEGVARPGHFRGVATVLTVLFNTIRPDFAFFGQKDAQQTLVVKRLARDLAFDIEVVVLPTVREQTGLALSSRNAYLTDEQRRAAAALYRSLAQAREVYLEGERNPRRLAEVVRSQLEAEPLARLEYVGVVDAETMDKFDRIPEDRPVLIALAAKVGATRLIDNIVIQPARQKARTTSEG